MQQRGGVLGITIMREVYQKQSSVTFTSFDWQLHRLFQTSASCTHIQIDFEVYFIWKKEGGCVKCNTIVVLSPPLHGSEQSGATDACCAHYPEVSVSQPSSASWKPQLKGLLTHKSANLRWRKRLHPCLEGPTTWCVLHTSVGRTNVRLCQCAEEYNQLMQQLQAPLAK